MRRTVRPPALRTRSLSTPGARAAFDRLVRVAAAVDGQAPFNDQALVDAEKGTRKLVFIVEPQESPSAAEHLVGAAILGEDELELVVDPEWRGSGYGGAAVAELLSDAPAGLKAWSHGDHPAARALARRFGFTPVRTLLQLRMPLQQSATTGTAFESFRPGVDEDEWVALNARIFAHHPEQGSITVDDLHAREAEEWFDPGDFLIARDEAGTMIGYNWLKIENDLGEVYVVGVDAPGRGLGRSLMLAGLERMRQRGCTTAALYVEADNTPAVALYRSLGFSDHTVDVQYVLGEPPAARHAES
ncbi:mycothiol synthase [Mycetocola zhujimingii]|uniref:Mycothiol acetyltransferase n=1 Tax=Mycetocola zhujimingii TaxID=2079792 RepID=A0A2U1TDQ7_9MICO|nr:mycothiol synthase [Mycetocola zhujimingii]